MAGIHRLPACVSCTELDLRRMVLCLEHKILLSGKSQHFVCELLRFEGSFGILRYILDREYNVDGFKLMPGQVSHALYWTDRPYTLYFWHGRENGDLYYFNIADRISLTADTFLWRDLVVDILITADRGVRILDEDELPDNLDRDLSAYIANAVEHIIENYRNIISEADSLLAPYLSRKA